MSQQNVEVVRSAHAALARGDLDGFLSLLDPAIEFTSLIVEAEAGGAFRGREGVTRWFQAVSAAFGDFHADLESVQPFGPQHVIVKLRMSGVTEGVQVTQTMWQAAVVRGGRLVSWGSFRTEADALEAVGLQE
jgi:ketosteroid isomerase-like protein